MYEQAGCAILTTETPLCTTASKYHNIVVRSLIMSLIRAIKSTNDEKHGAAGAGGATLRMCVRVLETIQQ